MNKPEHTVTVVTSEYPSGLKTAAEMAALLQGITEQRIKELADAGYMPHYRIDNGAPMFRSSEVKSWIANNLIAKCEGMAFPDIIRVVSPAPKPWEEPPTSISNIKQLQQLDKDGYQPGVYFLCNKNEVIYVGQSVTPASRVAQHANQGEKKFDRAYLLPVPESELNTVEAAFIHHLMPPMQGGLKVGREKPCSPSLRVPKEHVIEKYTQCTSQTN